MMRSFLVMMSMPYWVCVIQPPTGPHSHGVSNYQLQVEQDDASARFSGVYIHMAMDKDDKAARIDSVLFASYQLYPLDTYCRFELPA
jgi:hypothetical protein